MSIRRYCDICESEIVVGRTGPLFVEHTAGPGKRLRVELRYALNGTWNSGDVCNECMRAAVAKGHVVKE